MMDALITPMLCAIDIRGENTLRNSRTGSMYIVKPKCTVHKRWRLLPSCSLVPKKPLACPKIA